jgi:hypothetical protein
VKTAVVAALLLLCAALGVLVYLRFRRDVRDVEIRLEDGRGALSALKLDPDAPVRDWAPPLEAFLRANLSVAGRSKVIATVDARFERRRWRFALPPWNRGELRIRTGALLLRLGDSLRPWSIVDDRPTRSDLTREEVSAEIAGRVQDVAAKLEGATGAAARRR